MTKFPAVFDTSSLNGNNGFALTSSSTGFGGSVAGVGDINGDGKPDLIVAAGGAKETFIVFGATDFTSIVDVSNLNGTNGFKFTSSSIDFGVSVSGVGDINDDGISDFIVGARASNCAFVVFGSTHFPPALDTSGLNGNNGFTLVGPLNGELGWSVAGIGDINVDGKPDLIVGAGDANKAFVVFGTTNFAAIFNVSSLNGVNGFTLISSGAAFGISVAGIGDVNGDRKPDFIIGECNSNKAFVVFGATNFPSVLDTLNLYGNNGFTLIASNISPTGQFGFSVAGISDINGDGRLDFLIGTEGFYNIFTNKTFVVFGAPSFPVTLDVATLNGINGFTLTSQSNGFGIAVSGLGDINGDGKSDFGVGAAGANKAFVVFGASNFTREFDTSSLNGDNGFMLTSSSGQFGVNIAGVGDLNGNGRSDFIVGSYDAKAYVIYGFGEDMQQNYGMLSQIRYFVPMNSTESTGKMNLGSTGFWCNSDSLFVGDFNTDGRSDLLCSLEDGATYVMLSQLNAGQVTFAPMGTDPDGRIKVGINNKWCVKSIQQILIGDFNGDGKADLLCHNNQQFNQGANYVMLSTGDGFKPMADSADGYVQVGKLGSFCPIGSRLVIGNFDGMQGDDLLCNNPSAGNMIMVPNGKSFVSVNDDPLGTIDLGIGRACAHVWCADSGSVLMAGHFNNDNKADLICNAGGENQIMLATFSNVSCVFQPIYPASGGQKSNGWISMGQGSLPIWCDASKSKLDVADINGDKLSDLVCNTAGVNQIQICNSVGSDKYEFRSINAGDPSGDGRTKIADYDKWCNSQNLFSGDFSGNTLDDLWCNQNYSPVGEIYDEKVPT